MPARRIGVVLSSGGGRGVFGHTGFMLALDSLRVSIEASAGCSAGAIVGGIAASGTNVRDWVESLVSIETSQIWTPRSSLQVLLKLAWQQGRGFSGLSDTVAPIRFLTEHLSAQTFEECEYPFAAVAMNLGTVRKKTFDTGRLAPRLMASAAMPGLYEPVEIDGELFTDGAVIELAPADAICCQHRLDVLLVHHVARRDYSPRDLARAFRQPWTMLHIMHRLVYRTRPWYATGLPLAVHACPCGCDATIVVIEPVLPELAWPATDGGKAIVEAAQSHAVAQLRPLLEDLYRDPRAVLTRTQGGELRG